MVQVISTQNISTEGNGREDYSTSIDASSVPVIRGKQQFARGSITFTVPANTTVILEDLANWTSMYFYDMYISCSANVLIEASLYLGSYMYGRLILDHFAYNHIDLIINSSFPLADGYCLFLRNLSDISTEATLSYHGLVGGDIVYLE
jgi:hypothetical protein